MKCPNCQSENVQSLEDNKILCLKCDTVFIIEKDGAKVEKTDVIRVIDKRVSAREIKEPLEKPVGVEDDEPIISPPHTPEDGEDVVDKEDEIPDDNLYPA